MSNKNLEEDNEVLLTEGNLPSSIFGQSQYYSSYKEGKLRQDTKENDISLSLYGTGKVNFNDANSPRTLLERKQYIDKKNIDLSKKEYKSTIKEVQSPNSLNSSDLSYKILNEILNTHHGDRTQTRSKANSKTMEVEKDQTKFKLMGSTNSKPFFEENEELKNLQERIKSLKNQIQSKQSLLDSRRKNIERENMHLQENEAKSREIVKKLNKKLEEVQQKRTGYKDKTDITISREKLKRLTAESETYEREITKLSEAITKQEKDIENRDKAIDQQFETEIKELEEAVQTIQDQKIAIINKIKEIEDGYNEDLEKKSMLREDLNGKLLQRAELVAQREELDEIVESFKDNNSIEVDFYDLEVRTKKALDETVRKLNELNMEKKRHIIQLKEITDFISNQNDQIFLLTRNHKLLLQAKQDKPKIKENNSEEIQRMESLLNQKMQELRLPTLEEILAEFFENKEKLIEKEILSQQLRLIEKEELKMNANFQSKKENLYQAMDTLKQQKSDPDTKTALGELSNRLNQLETGYSVQKETLANWKESVLEAVNENVEEGTEDDAKVDQEKLMKRIDSLLRERSIGEKAKKDFYEILNRYFDLIYDNEVSNSGNGESEVKEEQRQLEEKIQQAKNKRGQVELEIRKIDDEFLVTTKRKKEIEEEQASKRANIESFLAQEAESAFNAYMTDQAGTFEVINRTYGTKAAQNLKREHYNEFLGIMRNNLAKKTQQFRESHDRLDYLDETIKNNTNIVDQSMLPSLKKILASLSEAKDGVSSLKKNQIALLEAEDEVNGRLNAVYEKLNEKKKTSKEDFDTMAFQSMKNLTETKRILEKRLKSAKDEMVKLEDSIINFDNVSTHDMQEEKKLQKEIKDLDKHLEQIEKVCKPKLQTNETDIERLEKEIFQLRKILEQFEIQKLAIEQNFIEQNYLSNDGHQQHNTINSYAIFNETLNLRNIEREGVHPPYEGEDEKGYTWKNVELSPIKDGSDSVLMQKKDPFYDNARNYQSVGSVQHLGGLEDYNSSGANSTQSLHQQFIRRTTLRPDQSEESSFQNSNHRRFESVPGLMATLDRRGQNVPIKATNNFNVSIKKLMDTSIDNKQSSVDNYGGHKPRVSHTGSVSRKEEDYLNMPLQKHRSTHSLSEHLNPQSSHGYRASPDLSKNGLNNTKGQEGGNRVNNGVGHLRTIHEEQGSYRDTPNNLSKLGILAPQAFLQAQQTKNKQKFIVPSYKDNAKRQQNATLKKNPSLGNSVSLEGTTDYTSSLMNSHSLHSIEQSNPSAYRSLQRNHSSSKEFQSIQGDRTNNSSSRLSGVFAYQTLPAPASSFGTRSKSLGAVNKNLSFEGGIEENLGEHRPHPSLSNINMANYSSVQSYKQDSIIRHLQGRSIDLKNPSSANAREGPSVQDQQLFETIKPLLEGRYIFKKFTTSQSLKRTSFDPLVSDVYPPEACGYGMRSIKLNKNLDRIEVKHPYKPGVELNISFGTILRPIVPQITMDVLRVQKKVLESQNPISYVDGRLSIEENYANMSSKQLILSQPRMNGNLRLDKYMNCTHYPFSILLEKGGRLEFVAPNYEVFRDWINGLNFLLKNRKHIPKMRRKIEEHFQ